jgi:hypothetical protein
LLQCFGAALLCKQVALLAARIGGVLYRQGVNVKAI